MLTTHRPAAAPHSPHVHVVVAAVVERDGHYLLVREHTEQGLRINQPAGHWEAGETLTQAVVREVLEETGYGFTPQGVLGFYTYWAADPAPTGTLFLRIAFVGHVSAAPIRQDLDAEIESVLWWRVEDMHENETLMRSPLVLRMIDDWAQRPPLPLNVLQDLRDFAAAPIRC